MATYYVRKTGLDANAGTSAGAAWLTIDKAANTVAANDTVYVGAGVYRELVTMDTSGTSGNQISFIADVDGSQTGDGGLVVVSAHDSDSAAQTRATVLDFNNKAFITWQGFVLHGGSPTVKSDDTTSACEEIIIEDCSIIAGEGTGSDAINFDINDNASPTNNGLTIRRCVINGNFVLKGNEASTDRDLKMTVENCVLMSGSDGSSIFIGSGILIEIVSTGTGNWGGISITNCSFSGFNYAVCVEDGVSATYPVDVRNCYIARSYYGLYKYTTNDGALTSGHNTFVSVQTRFTNVTAGTNDRENDRNNPLLGGFGDFPLYRFLGWSPYLPFEPIRFQDDAYTANLIADADTSVAPATDLYNNPRPMHGTVDDRGPVEGRARPEQETTTVRTGSNAIRFEGAGYHDFLIPVSAASTTVSIYGRFDSNYTGSKPKIDVLNIPGVADQTDIMTGAANAWEEMTATFTPTSAGVCRLRIYSQDTSATGEAFFDDLTVT